VRKGPILLVALVCALAVAACGGDDDDGAGAPPAFAIYDWEPNLVGGAEPFAEREEADNVAADNPGSIVVEAASQYHVIQDSPAVAIGDVASAEAVTSEATGEPAVAAELTPEGRRAFAELTREVARRTDAERDAQHFAVVVDGTVLSLPIIDTDANPEGISAREGLSIEGGLTESEAGELAATLNEE
jgi:preprotein translocase subunit SecD